MIDLFGFDPHLATRFPRVSGISGGFGITQQNVDIDIQKHISRYRTP